MLTDQAGIEDFMPNGGRGQPSVDSERSDRLLDKANIDLLKLRYSTIVDGAEVVDNDLGEKGLSEIWCGLYL